ncbi:MAG: NAD-dependent epimerase/dehydratase family protein [Bacteroidetes bacterium]|nr:NAD-dependent epimerase/dehydratase family protein [Bacteroidota bacterium]
MNFVTGGTGILGSRLIYDLLLSGEKVRALKRKDSNLDNFNKIIRFYTGDKNILNNLEWVEGDINDISSLEAMEGCDYVYHCAAAVSFFKNDRDHLFKVNVEGTTNVVNTALKTKVKKFCHVSSTAALGGSVVDGKITEESFWVSDEGRSNYAITKKLAELEVWRGIEEGLNAVIVNPSVILGPGNDKSSATIFTKVRDGLRFYTHGINGYVDVRDVSNIMIKLMHSDISGERFLAISENISFKELFDSIAEHLQKPAPSMEARKWMAAIIWRLEALRSALFNTPAFVTKETSNSAFSKSYYSNEKAKSMLKHDFIPISTSIKEISRFYKNS